MREIAIFSLAAVVVGTIFLVSLLELLLSIRRRKVNQELQNQIKELKAQYNTSINELVLKDDAAITTTESQLQEATAALATEKEALEGEYKKKLADLTKSSKKSLDAAKERASHLKDEAEQQADDYLASRKQEVEEELMNLVIAVSKKVLPKGISYEAQKELVMEALRDVKAEGKE